MANSNLFAQYIKDPRYSMSEGMMKEGTSTAPVQNWSQGLARLAQAGLGAYMAKKLRGEFENKDAQLGQERANAISMAMGRPAETEQIGDTSINWNEQKPNLMGAAAMASSPDNQDLANVFLGQQINQQNQANQFGQQKEMQQALFGQQKELAEMQLGRQQAMQDAMLKRQIELEKFKAENDPTKLLIKQIVDANQQQIGSDGVVGAPTLQGAGLVGGLAGKFMQKPLPQTIAKTQAEMMGDIQSSFGTQADLGHYKDLVDQNKLNLGFINNSINSIKNYLGESTPESRNYASFKSALEKMRNDSLRLNKGVQTEGDAQRAWNELLSNINDEGVVKQRLEEIQNINARAAQFKQDQLNQMRSEFGREPLNIRAGQSPLENAQPKVNFQGFKLLGVE